MLVGSLLILLGLFLIFAEVLIPSGGFISILAVGSFVGGYVYGFSAGMMEGMILLGGSLVLVPAVLAVAFRIFPKTSIGKKMIAEGTEDSKEERQGITQDEKALIGQLGIVKTQLRPSGIVEIDGIDYDVVSEGGLLDPQSKVQVVEVSGNRIVVREISEA